MVSSAEILPHHVEFGIPVSKFGVGSVTGFRTGLPFSTQHQKTTKGLFGRRREMKEDLLKEEIEIC